jgi:hypothetical protein
VVGLGVGGATGVVEFGEADGVFSEGAVSGGGDPAEGVFEGDVEPDDGGAAPEEVAVAGLDIGAAAEGEDAVA